MTTRTRDFQRSAVYEWERKEFPDQYKEALTLAECQELATAMYGKRMMVGDGRGRRRACANVNQRTPLITLPRWSRNIYVVSHEVAHWFNYRQCKTLPAHGGVFVWYRIRLLAEHAGLDADRLIESAKAHGLRVVAPG